MDLSKSGGKRACPTHRVHDAGCGVRARQTDCNRTIDESQNNEPPAGSPQCMTEIEKGIWIVGKGRHVSRAPADCARIGCEDVKYPDGDQREDDGLADMPGR